jgi:hypothetical protein
MPGIMISGIILILGGMTQEVFASISLPVRSAGDPSSTETIMTEQPYALEAKLRIPSQAPAPTPIPERRKHLPFRVGEQLTYSVKWGGISGGSVTIRVADIIDYQGHDVYQIVIEAQSNAFISAFYPLYYLLESLIDVEGLFSRRYWTKQDENGKKRERKYEFDQENNVAHQSEKSYYITYGIQDEVSAVFYVRTLDLEVGTPVYLDVYAKRQNWRVKCDVLKTETVKVNAGTFETILVEPELNFDGVLKKGKIKAWFTDDEHRILIQVKSKIAIGAITVELEDYQLGEEPQKLTTQGGNNDGN